MMNIPRYIRYSEDIISVYEKRLEKAIAKIQIYLNERDEKSVFTVFGDVEGIVSFLRKELLAEYKPTTYEELKIVPKLAIPSDMDNLIKDRLYQTSSCLGQLRDAGKSDYNRLGKQILNNLRDILHQIEILKQRIEKAKSGVPV